MRCLYCGKPLPLLKKLTGGGEFCSDAHRNKYQEEYNKLALSRLLQAQTPNAAGGAGNSLSPRALRQLPPPAPRAGGPRALPPPSSSPAAEPKKGGFAGLFSGRKPAAIEAPAPSSQAAAPPHPAASAVSETPAPAAKSSIWKTFVRAERPVAPPPPPPPPEPDPAAASFLLARVDFRKPNGKTLMAQTSIHPSEATEVPKPVGIENGISLAEPVPFDWEEAFLQLCCGEDAEVIEGIEEAELPAAAAVEPEGDPAMSEALVAEPLDAPVADEPIEELEVAVTASPVVEPADRQEDEGISVEATADESNGSAGEPQEEQEPALAEPPIASLFAISLVRTAPAPFSAVGLEQEQPFEGLILFPVCGAVDLGSLRPSPVREKIFDPASFSGELPAARPRSLTPRLGSRFPMHAAAMGLQPAPLWSTWRPALQFVPSPRNAAPVAAMPPPPPSPPPPAAPADSHHEVVINLAALGILEDE